MHEEFCGNETTVSNDPAILKWDLGIDLRCGCRVENASLEIRKIDRAWSQTGCFNLSDPISGSGPVPASSEHTLSSVDYDSLYIARIFWVSNGTSYYIKDADCYFTLQPSEWINVYSTVCVCCMHDYNFKHCMTNTTHKIRWGVKGPFILGVSTNLVYIIV